jgi:hypothetical protein
LGRKLLTTVLTKVAETMRLVVAVLSCETIFSVLPGFICFAALVGLPLVLVGEDIVVDCLVGPVVAALVVLEGEEVEWLEAGVVVAAFRVDEARLVICSEHLPSPRSKPSLL